MNLTTKFAVNDLVQHKFAKTGDNLFQVYEVLQVDTQTCMGGTQIHYVCRPLAAHKERDYSSENKEKKWSVGPLLYEGKIAGNFMVREDELVTCLQEVIDIIKSAIEPN